MNRVDFEEQLTLDLDDQFIKEENEKKESNLASNTIEENIDKLNNIEKQSSALTKDMKNILASLNGEPTDKTDFTQAAGIKLSYTKKQYQETDKYRIEIPDNFKTVKEEGRDFVAYLPNPDRDAEGYERDTAFITIYPSDLIPLTETMSNYAISEVKETIQENSILSTLQNNGFKIDNLETKNGIKAYSYLEFGSFLDYYFSIVLKDSCKLFHIALTDIDGTKKEIQTLLATIIDHITPKEQDNYIEGLIINKYSNKLLSEEELNEVKDISNKLYRNLVLYNNLSITNAAIKISSLGIEDVKNSKEATSEVKTRLKQIEKVINKYTKQFEEFLVNSKNTTDELLNIYIDLYTIIDTFKETKIEIDDNEYIKDKNNYLISLEKKIFTESIIKKVKPIVNKNKQEEEAKETCEFATNYKEIIIKNIKRVNEEVKFLKQDLTSTFARFDHLSERDRAQAVEITNSARRSIRDVYKDLITKTYQASKDEVKKGANYQFKAAVLEALDILIKDFETNQKDVKRILETHILGIRESHYSKVDTSTIELYYKKWKELCEEDPEYRDKQKQDLYDSIQKREEKEKSNESFINKLRKSITEEDHQKDIAEINEYKEKEINKRIKEAKEEHTKKIQDLNNKLKEDQQKAELEITKINISIKETEEEISNLHFYQIFKKTELEKEINNKKANIENIKANLTKTEKSIEKKENSFNISEDKIEIEIESELVYPEDIEIVLEYIEDKIKYPLKEKTNEEIAKEKEIAKDILDVLDSKDHYVTLYEISKSLYHSILDMKTPMEKLVLKGEVEKAEDRGKTYYKRAYGIKPIIDYPKLIDSKTDTSFSRLRNSIYNILKRVDPDNEDDILELIKDRLYDISDYKIFEALSSLKDQVVIEYKNNKFICTGIKHLKTMMLKV